MFSPQTFFFETLLQRKGSTKKKLTHQQHEKAEKKEHITQNR